MCIVFETRRYYAMSWTSKFDFIFLFCLQTEREAAQTSIFLAADKDLSEVTGQFFCDCEVSCVTAKKGIEFQ